MIGILCSGLGLGHYVPGLLISEELAAAGMGSRVLVFESFIDEEQRRAIVKARGAYQRNSALLRIGQKLIPKMHSNAKVDVGAIRDAIGVENISRFVVLTGFWLPVLAKLSATRSIATDLLHVDSISSPSWEAQCGVAQTLGATHVWFSNFASGLLDHAIDVKCPQLAFGERRHAVIAHGGGWAVGTYKDSPFRIAGAGYDVDIVLPADADAPQWTAGVFRLDPQWEAWSATGQPASFPPLLGEAFPLDGARGRPYHDLLEVARQVKGVVSKPGGATILDCLASATPLIYVEPQGDHEARNAELWVTLGLAISLEDWERASFSEELLYQLHLNIRRVREHTPSYARERILAS